MINRIGMTGYGATCVSTYTKAHPKTTLAENKPTISELDQSSSSVDFKLKPSKRHPTVPTSVVEPKKSILLNLS